MMAVRRVPKRPLEMLDTSHSQSQDSDGEQWNGSQNKQPRLSDHTAVDSADSSSNLLPLAVLTGTVNGQQESDARQNLAIGFGNDLDDTDGDKQSSDTVILSGEEQALEEDQNLTRLATVEQDVQHSGSFTRVEDSATPLPACPQELQKDALLGQDVETIRSIIPHADSALVWECLLQHQAHPDRLNIVMDMVLDKASELTAGSGHSSNSQKAGTSHSDSQTAGISHHGDSQTAGTSHHGDSQTAGSSHHGDNQTAGTHHHCDSQTAGTSHHGDSRAAGTSHHGDSQTAGTSHHSDSQTAGTSHHSDSQTAGTGHHSDNRTAGTSHHGDSWTAGTSHHGDSQIAGTNHHSDSQAADTSHHGDSQTAGTSHHCDIQAAGISHHGDSQAAGTSHHGDSQTAGTSHHGDSQAAGTSHHGDSQTAGTSRSNSTSLKESAREVTATLEQTFTLSKEFPHINLAKLFHLLNNIKCQENRLQIIRDRLRAIPTTATPASSDTAAPEPSAYREDTSSASTASTPKPSDSASTSTTSVPKPSDSTSTGTASTPKPSDPSSTSTTSMLKPSDPSSTSTMSMPKPSDSSSTSTTSTPKPSDSSSTSTTSMPKPSDTSSTSTTSTPNPSDSSSTSTTSMPKPSVRREDSASSVPFDQDDPVFRDMLTISEIFPEQDRNVLYAMVGAHFYKKDRVQIVIEELMQMARNSQDASQSQPTDVGVSSTSEEYYTDLLLQADMDHLREVFPDCDPNYIFEQLESRKHVHKRAVVIAESMAELRNYPRLKDIQLVQTKLAEKTKLHNMLFTLEEFLAKFPDPSTILTSTNKPMSDRYKAHVDAQLKYSFPDFKQSYITSVVHKHNYHLFPIVKDLEAMRADILARGGMSKKLRDVPKEEPLEYPEDPDELFFYELWYCQNEQKVQNHNQEQAAIRLAKVEAARAENGLYTCNCCFDDECLFEDMMVACEDEHLFCRECIQHSVKAAFGDGKIYFPCLDGVCKNGIPEMVLNKVVPPDLLNKVMGKRQEEEVKQAAIPDLVDCPFCTFAKCMADPTDLVFHCLNPDCLKDSCRLCREPDHLPLKCEEVEKQKETDMRTYIEKRVTEAMLRKCHRCGKRFVKDFGCNKMTCTCGATSCYVCREPDITYDHFNTGRCNEGDMNKLHREEMEKAAREAKEEYLRDHPEAADIHLMHDPTLNINPSQGSPSVTGSSSSSSESDSDDSEVSDSSSSSL